MLAKNRHRGARTFEQSKTPRKRTKLILGSISRASQEASKSIEKYNVFLTLPTNTIENHCVFKLSASIHVPRNGGPPKQQS
jgi:hypothetical protein